MYQMGESVDGGLQDLFGHFTAFPFLTTQHIGKSACVGAMRL